MSIQTIRTYRREFVYLGTLATALVIGLLGTRSLHCHAQEADEQGKIGKVDAEDNSGKIIIHTHGDLPDPPVFFTASSSAEVHVGLQRIEQDIHLKIRVIQGKADIVSLGLNGQGTVVGVESPHLRSWAVRQEGAKRFLDFHLKEDVAELSSLVKIHSEKLKLPVEIGVTHLTPGEAVGFDSILNLSFAAEVKRAITQIEGFSPLESTSAKDRFQSSVGGKIAFSLRRQGGAPEPVEFSDTRLKGQLHSNGKSIGFQLRAKVDVNEAGSEVAILSGNAALSQMPVNDAYRLRLTIQEQKPVYILQFVESGSFDVTIDFVAELVKSEGNREGVDFKVAASAVVPIELGGLAENLEFRRDKQYVVPVYDGNNWTGFLPVTGHAKFQWKAMRKAGEGKLFFTTNAQVETRVGVGLLRQDHQIDYRVLQGELESLSIALHGPGEILDVRGSNVVAWKVSGDTDQRVLDVTLNQPITGSSGIRIDSQTSLSAFPVRADGLSLAPEGAIRHSGYLRLSNLGSVRIEPTGLTGLTQLAPEQFPGKPIKARQVFVYRFPAADHEFAVVADRIQPEVSISQLVIYELAETDRMLKADIELDIREAPIRGWDFVVPADYSVVSVTGSNVADYVIASEVVGNLRNLKVIFSQDMGGRQLISLHLEKNEPATEQQWVLPQIKYPGTKDVRGDIGIVGAPGFRVAVKETNLLVERPLSYFPKPVANLQQAFRIREPGWLATMHVEMLDRSVQADVFHLYSLSHGTIYGSSLLNYFVTGAPISELSITVPEALENIMIDGQDVRSWRRDGDLLTVSLHQPVMGPYTLLITFEEKPDIKQSSFQAGLVSPTNVQGERGYIQVVSPTQVEIETQSISDDLLQLDALELPAEFRLLTAAPALGTWQYTERPFDLTLKVAWFEPGTTISQVVEFSEVKSRVSQDGELVTDVLYYVKSRGQRTFKIQLPESPVRLWEVTVDGKPVTALQAGDATLVPLPGRETLNQPVEVRLRLGKPSVNEGRPVLTLPTVFAPVVKTQWSISGDEQHVLVPSGGTVSPPEPVLRPTAFSWVAQRGIGSLFAISILSVIGIVLRGRSRLLRSIGLIALGLAVYLAIAVAASAHLDTAAPSPLELSLPILSAEETVELRVTNTPLWRVNLSWFGLLLVVGGIALVGRSLFGKDNSPVVMPRSGGAFLIAMGVLLQRDLASWFFAILAGAIFLVLFVPEALLWMREVRSWYREYLQRRRVKDKPTDQPGSDVVTATLLTALIVSCLGSPCLASEAEAYKAVNSIEQQWQVTRSDARLTASGTVILSGQPGDQFLLLQAPAVLTQFEGEGLRLTKTDIPGAGLAYVISIPVDESNKSDEVRNDNATATVRTATNYRATFGFQLEGIKATQGIAVLTGPAAFQSIDLSYNEADWEVRSTSAVRIESLDAEEGTTKARVLLRPGEASVVLVPKARDVSKEKTQFFVEGSNLYLAGPGVVDGRHLLNIRMSQGQLSDLVVRVPHGLTVSEVTGPVGSWQFDADARLLRLEISPKQSQAFNVLVATQRGLDPLPADVSLAPLRVSEANGEVGLLGVAFGADAQPEKLEPRVLSTVNLGDFNAELLPNKKAVLHRVFRYGAEDGELAMRVAPVDSEVRVFSKQVLSLGDERAVLSINFTADISRAGLFQLSFPLPDGFEVESLSGSSLHHWAELREESQRKIVLHLNGKTLGKQDFVLSMTAVAPREAGQWSIPRFALDQATRQTGELVVQPTTGIRLETTSRENVTETDPRTLGGQAAGALAFRLLQRDWTLVLGIEKLSPWVTGQLLHDVLLREGQTRSRVIGNFNVQNASIREMQIELPITSEEEAKTLRASGKIVSDLVRTAPDSNVWLIQFKRRIIGNVQFYIEYERRGDRANDREVLSPIKFPQSRQVSHYFAVRTGGRLELEQQALPSGWQQADWNTIPQPLRDAGNRNAPALAVRTVPDAAPLTVIAKRHSLADALKLRVARGTLTTVVSPSGDQLTDVQMTMEVIQRSSLTVSLPPGGEIFSIFVNDESVHSIRQDTAANIWQFYILPGIDDRTAKVRFVYAVPGKGVGSLRLRSPQLNVPLENIEWRVMAPQGYELSDSDGDLDLLEQLRAENYDRDSYLSKVSAQRNVQAEQAAELLEQANQLLQAGEQSKARWALNSVANRYALDAASNEDARVQLNNLQTQQAIVGLNTRRQRVYLDNDKEEAALLGNQQILEAAAENPILQQEQLNFRPQELSDLLRGNTSESNYVLQQIASRLVKHQRTTEPAPQAITISLPEEGTIYSFARSVQVAENKPLELDLNFDPQIRLTLWQSGVVIALLAVCSLLLATLSGATPLFVSSKEVREAEM